MSDLARQIEAILATRVVTGVTLQGNHLAVTSATLGEMISSSKTQKEPDESPNDAAIRLQCLNFVFDNKWRSHIGGVTEAAELLYKFVVGHK